MHQMFMYQGPVLLTLCTKIFAVVYMYGVNYTCVTGTIGSIHLRRYVWSMFGRCNQCVVVLEYLVTLLYNEIT